MKHVPDIYFSRKDVSQKKALFPLYRAVDSQELPRNPYGRIDGMHGTENPRRKLDRLVRTLSGMTAHLGYGIAVNFNFSMLGVYCLYDPGKKWVALLCSNMGSEADSEADEDRTAGSDGRVRSLLDTYESSPSWTAYFYDSWDSLTLPGGSVEEIELKAAVGVKALFRSYGRIP